MKNTYLSLVRHLLSLAGGVAVAHGYLSKTEAVELGGALIALAGFLWGSLDEWIAARKIEEDARIKAAVRDAMASVHAFADELRPASNQISETKSQS